MELDTIVCGDALEVMATLPADSVDLIVTDPPYFRVKGEWWDRQWDNPAAFLDWMGRLCEQWQRILKPNGSLYVFASPEMADRVSVRIRERFNVLNHIVWAKPQSRANQANKEILRSYFGDSERIIFAEHHGADGYARGEAGYSAECDELRGFVFEPLRAYLDSERLRAGITYRQVNAMIGKPVSGGGMATHYFSDPTELNRPQWALPTKEHYEQMRDGFARLNHGGTYLRREYEDLRREYEDLRREYEDLRRPFNATPDAPYTDVWTFKTVSSYPGKHPCEKPLDLMRHIVRMSSKPGAVVADFFMGSGTTAEAALHEGRHWLGCDISQEWVGKANGRVERARRELTQLELSL